MNPIAPTAAAPTTRPAAKVVVPAPTAPAAPVPAPTPVHAQAARAEAANRGVWRAIATVGGAAAGLVAGGAVGAVGSVAVGALFGLGEAYLGVGMIAMCAWAVIGAVGGGWGANRLVGR